MQNINTLLIILAALQLADWYTTAKILSNGGRELNPVMRKLIDSVGLHPALFAKGVLIVFAAWYIMPDIVILQFLVILYALIVFHNWRQLP